ncbi:t-SNARE [Pseudovirgaria hyperparasitica]|uniref:t-SNARE n=1 Tax=Pseudovirgaria hyperparasitica TaxID=470096 RepID=A0A6A6W8H5_9PEZI|nr:t-SNARE [Pseudovirgaria hyperparasitica]KAF2759152.1 t-SNARE [Pseudovirgaria hyperparasitica]
MSYNQYSGNPYGQTGESGYDAGNRMEGGYGSSNPYGGQGGYGSSNPYGGQQQQGRVNQPPLQHETSNYSQQDHYVAAGTQPGLNSVPEQMGPQPLSREEYLERIDMVKQQINELTHNISEIGNLHQRMIASPDNSSSARLENLVSQTQILNTNIKDQIKYLEKDALRSEGNKVKDSQIRNLKKTFHAQLLDYQKQENSYEQRYRETIARQYRIVNPDATDAEVEEATNANWGDEGIFQTALKTNRVGQANSVLGAVRARHNDIVNIEKAMTELATLFMQLDEQVTYQEPLIQNIEQQADAVHEDTKKTNVELKKATEHALRTRRMKWWCVGIVLVILAIIGIVLGVYFGAVNPPGNNNNNNNNNNNGN